MYVRLLCVGGFGVLIVMLFFEWLRCWLGVGLDSC